jgi:hypothetical protein
LRAEFDTKRVFASLRSAQQELDEWVAYYNQQRPHQARDGATPAEVFYSRQVASNGVISVSWQQICLGVAHAGARVDVEVHDELLQVWRGDELIKTVARTSRGTIRNKNASIQDARTGRQRPQSLTRSVKDQPK